MLTADGISRDSHSFFRQRCFRSRAERRRQKQKASGLTCSSVQVRVCQCQLSESKREPAGCRMSVCVHVFNFYLAAYGLPLPWRIVAVAIPP